MKPTPRQLKTGELHNNAPKPAGSAAFAVSHHELSRHDNWSAGFHGLLSGRGGQPEQLRAFQRYMDEIGVSRIEVERALMQAKSADAAVENVLHLVLKRTRAGRRASSPEGAEGKGPRLRGAVTPAQLRRIEALVRSLVDLAVTKEKAQAERSSKRMAHLGRLTKAESLVDALLR